MKKLGRPLVLALALALALPHAHAGLVTTEQVLGAVDERARITQLVQRADVARQLERMGLPAHDVAGRVAAMSEEEVAQLAGQINALPAGGQLTTENLLYIIIIILLILVIL
jgi:hypothetical protein